MLSSTSNSKLRGYLIGLAHTTLSLLAMSLFHNPIVTVICVAYFYCSAMLLLGLLTEQSWAVRQFIALQMKILFLIFIASIVFRILQMFFDYCTKVHKYHTIPHHSKYCCVMWCTACAIVMTIYKMNFVLEGCCEAVDRRKKAKMWKYYHL